MEIISQIPELFIDFLITLFLSLLIGFEQRKRRDDEKADKDETESPSFGTDRTFAFIGIMGFLLYVVSPQNLYLFIAGLIILLVLLGVFYFSKIQRFNAWGLTSILVAFITYSIGPILITQPKWLTVLIVVSVLILVERKQYFKQISEKIDIEEFTTLAKFLIVAGVILPILPRDVTIPYISLSPYEIWLTVVIVSAISYLSYLLQTYFFRKSGVLITGILGGTYSSTATTVIISKRSREVKSSSGVYAASIIFANAMMYLRVLILMFIFNSVLAYKMLPYFGILIASAAAIGFILYLRKKPHAKDSVQSAHKNPLELKVSLMFAGLFILFSVVTAYTITNYGTSGLDILSFITGFTDIDPFLLNIFQGKYELPLDTLGRAALQAIISNNILKSIYILSFAERQTKILAGTTMGIITLITAVLAVIVEVMN
ncbi:MAG TPA: DUF4010 domain-containing protein [Ignavibacteria bacterium]|nr:hypothetical protein [Bacteroidota bacterium]HRE10497.1 DUF4010 domain-containing protein [Ignavibacteria bacterium]HRF65159.1 DUF4010 domain-containing protein [Ignavibacteria bacterium]HRJ03989.1 DUF4010 domain-containing protein [Ignavibacteria bacterium]